MIEPYRGRVYDPCCGSGGMFVQSQRFIQAHGGRRDAISVYGQEQNPTTWRMCKMNLAIRGIEANLGEQWADSFTNDQHKDLRADFILANPPFNISNWKGDLLREDARWKYGVPPVKNANFAWVQHFIHHLGPNGTAGFVLANGSLSSNQSGEGEIRRRIVEADLVDCIVALPGQLFYSTQIPVALWFVTKNKSSRRLSGDGSVRDRRGETLFIDARKMGHLVDRIHRELSDEDIARIAHTYHAWRGEDGHGQYQDVPGFSKSTNRNAIAAHDFVLTPGRYVGAGIEEDLGEPFEITLARLTGELKSQMMEARQLDEKIEASLRRLKGDEGEVR
jgi:type I restriction enzyme M protein